MLALSPCFTSFTLLYQRSAVRDDAYYDKYFWVYPECDRAHALDKGEAIKMLKGGIEMSDRVLTVSPSYCQVP